MSRWALYVDAGWVFAAGTTAAFREAVARVDIGWDPPSLVDALVTEARELVPDSSELLRVYWYDGAPNRQPLGQQLEVAALPDVKLRLGRTAFGRHKGVDGAAVRQKGVDGLIILDLLMHSLGAHVTDAVVVSGDEDLLEAIEAAQANGTRVHLLEIPIGGISDSMLRAPDRRRVLTDEFWQLHLSRLDRATPVATESTTTGGIPPSSVLPRPPVRPDWLDRPLAPSTRPSPLSASLDQITEVTTKLARQWKLDHTTEEWADLLGQRPWLPTDLDARILRALSEALDRYLDGDETRHMRNVFWTELVAPPTSAD